MRSRSSGATGASGVVTRLRPSPCCYQEVRIARRCRIIRMRRIRLACRDRAMSEGPVPGGRRRTGSPCTSTSTSTRTCGDDDSGNRPRRRAEAGGGPCGALAMQACGHPGGRDRHPHRRHDHARCRSCPGRGWGGFESRAIAAVDIIAVDEAMHGRGVGRALMDAGNAWAWKPRADDLGRSVYALNAGAIGVYEHPGIPDGRRSAGRRGAPCATRRHPAPGAAQGMQPGCWADSRA